MADSRFFHTKGPFKLSELAKLAECKIYGIEKNPELGNKLVNSVASLESATSNDISFLDNPKYMFSFQKTNAGACVVREKYASKASKDLILLISENPYFSYAVIANTLHPQREIKSGISKDCHISKSAKIGEGCQIMDGAVISENVEIGKGTLIGPNVYIDEGVIIGDNCFISNSATLSYCMVGDNVIIHGGVRIGQDGFGFATAKGKHIKVPQLGRVIIGNDVEIGANTCIDRGAGPDTVIGDNTKIDNLVQIGHNVKIGKGCIIVAQVGISGSTKLGDYVVVGGQAGLVGHISIGSGAKMSAQSGVITDIPAGEVYGGYPAVPIKQWHRQTIAIKNLIKKGSKNND